MEGAIAFSFGTISGEKFATRSLPPGETLRYTVKPQFALPPLKLDGGPRAA